MPEAFQEFNREDFATPVVEEKPVVSPDQAAEVAASTVYVNGDPDPVNQYHEIKQGILTEGRHPSSDSLLEVLSAQHADVAASTAAALAAEGIYDNNALLDNARKSIEEYVPSLTNAVADKAVASNEPSTKASRDIFDNWSQEAFDQEIEEANELSRLVDDAYNEFDLTWGMAGDMLLTFLPFYESAAFIEFAQKMGVDHDVHEKVLPGELLENMRDHVRALDSHSRVEFFNDMNRFLKENAGVLGGNEAVRLGMLIDTFSEVTGHEDPDDFDWERWLLDFSGLMDLTVIGGPIARGVSRVFRGAKTNIVGRVSSANPQAGAQLAELIAKQGAEEAGGETASTLRAKYVLPKEAEWKLSRTPEVVRKAIMDADEEAGEVVQTIQRIDDYVGEEAKLAAKELQRKLQNSDGNTVWVADTSLQRTSKGWRADALVADSDESGFASLEAAKKANKDMFNGKGTIVERTIKTDELVETGRTVGDKPVVKQQLPGTEYFIKVGHSRDVAFMDDDFAITGGGFMRSFFFDPDSRFNKRITTKGNAVFDQYKLLEQTIERRFNFIAQLGNNEKLVVSKLLSRGLQRERVYTPREITRLARKSGIKDSKIPDLVEAYQEARRGFDTMYIMEERIFRNKLVADGYEAVVTGPGGFRGFGKPVPMEQAGEVKRVYNPATDSMEDVGDIAKIYEDGGEIVRVRNPIRQRDGDEQSRFIVRNSDDIKMDELPLFTLNYRQGWVPTMYKENYFITATSPIKENGKNTKVTRVIGVTGTKNEALEKVARMNEDAVDGTVFEFKHDRNIGLEETSRLQSELHATHGKLFYSRKGERLKHEDGSVGKIQDPLEAAINAARTVSKRTAMDEFIVDLKARYVNTFGDITHSQFELPSRDLVKDISSGQIEKAQSMYNYIKQLEGVAGKGFDERLTLIKTADKLESWGFPKVASLAREGSDRLDAIGWTRARNFEFNLGTDPLRQLLLQPSQTLFTAILSPSQFVTNLAAGRLVTRLAKDDLSGHTVEELDKIARNSGLRAAGIGGKELRGLIDEFRQTGLGQAVTSHQVARDSAKPLSVAAHGGKGEKVLSAAASVYTTPVSLLRQGFERGEEINLGTHWMLARSRWMKNNPGKNPADHILEVSGEARALALSMTQAGDFSYQRGIMSIPLQYFSIRHKGLLALTGNQHFTKGEKFKMAAAQLAMWGPEGLALGGLMDWARQEYGVELPEWFRDGIVETFANNALSSVSEDTDVDITGTFALLKGVDKDNIVAGVTDIIVNGGDLSGIAFGATKTNYNRIDRFFDSASILMNTDMSNASFDDIAGLAKDDFLKVLSSYNRMATGLAMLRSGHWMNSKGEEIMPASVAESVLYGLLGLSSNRVEAMYELQQAISPPAQRRKTDLEETVDTYYRLALQFTNKALDDLDAGAPMQHVWAQHKALMSVNNLIVSSMGPDAEIVMDKVRNRVQQGSKGNKQDELVDKLGRLYMNRDNANLIEIAKDEGLVTEGDAAVMQNIYDFMWEAQ